MCNCFEQKTKSYLCGEYFMLIVDKYVFHVSTEFIWFAQEYKIVWLCLLAYSTHLLQPLDNGVFGLLKQRSKTLLSKITRFIIYNIDKADFIF